MNPVVVCTRNVSRACATDILGLVCLKRATFPPLLPFERVSLNTVAPSQTYGNSVLSVHSVDEDLWEACIGLIGVIGSRLIFQGTCTV